VYCEQLRVRLGHVTWLDFTAESLEEVDRHLLHRRPFLEEMRRDLVLEVTAYFGEVLRRTLNASWRVNHHDPLMPTLTFPTGETEYPLIRAVKLIEGADRLHDWYDFLARGGRRLLD
jgi:hypothetical protein